MTEDLRSRHNRDAQILAQIDREGGFSLSWLVSNRDHAASVHRLMAIGAIGVEGSGWIRIEQASPWVRAWRAVFGGPNP